MAVNLVYNRDMDNLSPTHRFLHAYCIKPELTFESQQKNEEVILVLRAHPITQITWVFNSLILVLLLIIFQFLPLPFFTPQEIFLITVYGVIFIISYIWLSFLNWYF